MLLLLSGIEEEWTTERKVHDTPLSTLPLGRDGMLAWPDEFGRQGAEGVRDTEADNLTVVGLAMQLWQA